MSYIRLDLIGKQAYYFYMEIRFNATPAPGMRAAGSSHTAFNI